MLLRSHQRRAYERLQQTARTLVCPVSSGFSFAFRLVFPYGLSVVRRSISKPLADDAFERKFGACGVVDPKRDAVRIPEIELCQISMQVLLFAMLIHAFHSAFEDRVVPFDGVGGDDVTLTLGEVPDVGVAD